MPLTFSGGRQVSGGGGSSSTVSDAEFNSAIQQDYNNRNSISGGGNYYNSGSSSAAQQQASAAALARAQAEQRAAAKAAAEKAAFDKEFNAAIAQLDALDAAYASGGTKITSSGTNNLSFNLFDPYSGQTTTYNNTDFGTIQDLINEAAAFDKEFAQAEAESEALNKAYNLNAVNIRSSGIGDLSYDFVDPETGRAMTMLSSDGLAQAYIASADRTDAIEKAIRDKEREEQQTRLAEQKAVLAEREKAEEDLKNGTTDPLAFLDAFNNAQAADLNAPVEDIMVRDTEALQEATGISNFTDTTGEIIQAPTVSLEEALGTSPISDMEFQEAEDSFDFQGQALENAILQDSRLNRAFDDAAPQIMADAQGRIGTDYSTVQEQEGDVLPSGIAAPDISSDNEAWTDIPAKVWDFITGGEEEPTPDVQIETLRNGDNFEQVYANLLDQPESDQEFFTYQDLLNAGSGVTTNAAPMASFSTDAEGAVSIDSTEFTREFIDPETGMARDLGDSSGATIQGSAMGDLFNQTDAYGTGPKAEENFLKDSIKAIQASKANIEEGSLEQSLNRLTGERTFRLNNEGKVVVNEGITYGNIGNEILDFVANKVISNVGSKIASALTYSFIANPFVAIGAGILAGATIDTYKPIERESYVGPDGTKYTYTTGWGSGDGEMASQEEIADRVVENQKAADKAVASGSMNNVESAMLGIEISNAESAGRAAVSSDAPSSPSQAAKSSGFNPSDYFSFSLNPFEAVSAVATGVGATAEAVKAVEVAEKVSSGTNAVEAVAETFVPDIAADIVDEYPVATKAAIEIATGKNPVDVFVDNYGVKVGLDTPIETAVVEGVKVYDQTGSLGDAAVATAKTYIENGGTLPDINVNLEGTSDIFPEGFDFSKYFKDLGIKFGDLAEYAIDFFDLPEFSGLPDGFFAGVDWKGISGMFPDVSLKDFFGKFPEVTLPSFAGITGDMFEGMSWANVQNMFPDVSWPEFNAQFPEVDFPDGPEFADVNIDLDLPDFDFEFGFGSTPVVRRGSFTPLIGEQLGVSEIDPVKYSQILLENARKV